MKRSDFNYDLPTELIAQSPSPTREGSRLLVLDKDSGETRHRHFHEITSYLKRGDCLVLNDTRVLPARLLGQTENGGNVELVLLRRMEGERWEVLARPGKKAVPGRRFIFGGGLIVAVIEGVLPGGNRVVRFLFDGEFMSLLDRVGMVPLPPYIKKEPDENDRERYQTVYAKHPGSAAAPTAGLHFTPELLRQIGEKGVEVVYLTLHVGLGTFRPVKCDNIEEHEMHAEYYSVSEEAATAVNRCRERGGRVVAVGTTSCRTLETAADSDGRVSAGEGESKIFIYPGYRFKAVDALVTNFHLPESTLIMLVSALAGRDNVLSAYKEAIDKRYRFFSFGDAMLISGGLPEEEQDPAP